MVPIFKGGPAAVPLPGHDFCDDQGVADEAENVVAEERGMNDGNSGSSGTIATINQSIK